MKPGIKTTEFWVVALTTLINFGAQAGMFGERFDAAATIGAVGSAAAVVAYIFGRGWVKKANGGG